ncbi:MAG TPA: hypothetical protein VLW45_02480 [Pelomicrobium sp.]|nr:hypothetical protein [Pelomicrobium sp.]
MSAGALAWLAFALALLAAWEMVRLARRVSRRGAVAAGDVRALALLTISGIALLGTAGWLLAAKPAATWPAWLAIGVAVGVIVAGWRRASRDVSSDEAEAARLNDPVYALLRREVTRVGQEFERRGYDELQAPAERLSFSRTVDGVEIHFGTEAYDRLPNGDLAFCIDASAKPNATGVQPSYRFYKRPDGSVYY